MAISADTMAATQVKNAVAPTTAVYTSQAEPLRNRKNRVFCSVRSGNTASRRVCEKAGMRHEGTLRQHYARQDGGYDDVCIYGIIRADMEDGYEP